NGSVPLLKGATFLFTNEKTEGDEHRVYISYPNFHSDVQVGEKVLIDDGKIEVLVQEILPNNDVKVEVLTGGMLSSNKGINLPQTKISLPSLTEKDKADIDFIIGQEDVDWVALSF